MRVIARKRLDESGQLWRQSAQRMRLVPSSGWIAAIREALGMSQTDLAARVGVRRTTVAKLEESERSRTIQLDTLQRVADAINCDVVYALVPRKPLQTAVDDQRLELLTELHRATQQHMRLENQEVIDPAWREDLLREAEKLIPDSQLWHKLP